MLLNFFFDSYYLWVTSLLQVGSVSIGVIGIGSKTKYLGQLFSVEKLVMIRIFGPEASDFLISNVCTLGKIDHGCTELLPSGKRLAFCVLSEFSNCYVYLFFKILIKTL